MHKSSSRCVCASEVDSNTVIFSLVYCRGVAILENKILEMFLFGQSAKILCLKALLVSARTSTEASVFSLHLITPCAINYSFLIRQEYGSFLNASLW